jgi:hypothetical protein
MEAAEDVKDGILDAGKSTKDGIMTVVDKTTEVVKDTGASIKETVTGKEELPNFDFTPCETREPS